MKISIEVDIPSNHALNNTWILQNELTKLGLTVLDIKTCYSCCLLCGKCVRTDDVRTLQTVYHCKHNSLIQNPEQERACPYFEYKPNIDKEESPVGPMHKIGDRWIPD